MRKTFKYNYTAFGYVLSDSGTFDNNYRYTSQAIDENDLYYLHARYYDMRIGRFVSEVPILQSGYIIYSGKCIFLKCTTNYFPLFEHQPKQLNKYLYVANNPINCLDPEGKGIVCTIVWYGVSNCLGYTIEPTLERNLWLCATIFAFHRAWGFGCFTALLGPYVWCIIENMDCYDDKKPPPRSRAGVGPGIPRPLPY